MHLNPYGNAKEIQNPDGTFAYKCQHGERECAGNFREACIIYKTGYNATKYFPVLECMEASGKPLIYGKKCLKTFQPQIKWKNILDCASVSLN